MHENVSCVVGAAHAQVRYHVCGRVDTGADAAAARERRVVLTNAQFQQQLTATADATGSFCFEVVPGTYTVRPAAVAGEEARGIVLAPPEREVAVVDR